MSREIARRGCINRPLGLASKGWVNGVVWSHLAAQPWGFAMEVEGVDGTTLTYDVAGDGQPLVLIHGSWGERQTWGFVLPALAESFRVISYDRRGHGESTAPPDAGTVHDDVADVAALIDALGDGRAHVVANSYGACIALRLAAAHPERVVRMVCHEPPMLGVLDADDDSKAISDEERRKLAKCGSVSTRVTTPTPPSTSSNESLSDLGCGRSCRRPCSRCS